MFKTKEIIKATRASLSGASSSRTYKNVSQNSKTVSKKDLFIAIRGEKFDGHQFLEEVFKRGCQGAVVQKGKSLPTRGIPKVQFFVVKDTTKALGELATFHRKRFKMPVIWLNVKFVRVVLAVRLA